MFKKVFLALSLLLILASSGFSKRIYVPGDSATIQAGVNGADEPYDTVYVAAGTYTGVGNRDILIFNKTIMVWSESGAVSTIIDCEGTLAENHIGFNLSGPNNYSHIKGFTITGSYNESDSGAVYANEASPMIRNCVVTNNTGHGISSYSPD